MRVSPLLIAVAIALPSLAMAGDVLPDLSIAGQRRALVQAQRDAAVAERHAAQLERDAKAMKQAAERSVAEQAAAAAAIQSAEARTAAAQVQVALIDRLRAAQRARLAERQGPIVRLTAALQTMARRPTGLALVQPGSVNDLVHIRALLGSTLPVIRERTAGLRAEVARGDALRLRAQNAVAALRYEQDQLGIRRVALARLEADQRRRSQGLVDNAMAEQDRQIAMGERAKDIVQLIADLGDQADIRTRLASLSGPLLRPQVPGQAVAPSPIMLTPVASEAPPPSYRLPVIGRLVSGMGEISEAGVRTKGITLATARGAQIVAPAAGRIAYAGPFRGYAAIVIIDHDNGWASLLTGMRGLTVHVGDPVIQGSPLGTADGRDPRVSVELRHKSEPVDIMPLATRG